MKLSLAFTRIMAGCLIAQASLLGGIRPLVHAAADSGDNRLFAQSSSAMLDAAFPSKDISYLLLDVRSGEVLAQRWVKADEPIPVGSLIKPFVAVAYGETHEGRFPRVACHGVPDRCWRPSGHGALTLEPAIAYSCNAYFLALAAQLSTSQVDSTAGEYGIPPPPSNSSPEALIGLSSDWHVAPLALSRAYLRLMQRPDDPTVERILSGMALSAHSGTAQKVDEVLGGRDALAKTGTAQCRHQPRAAGDGFVVVMAPAKSPRYLLMVRVHGTTGANAASIAGQMLRLLQSAEHPS